MLVSRITKRCMKTLYSNRAFVVDFLFKKLFDYISISSEQEQRAKVAVKQLSTDYDLLHLFTENIKL